MNKVAPTPISKSSYTVTYDLDGLQTFQLQAIETLSMTQNGEDDLVFYLNSLEGLCQLPQAYDLLAGKSAKTVLIDELHSGPKIHSLSVPDFNDPLFRLKHMA